MLGEAALRFDSSIEQGQRVSHRARAVEAAAVSARGGIPGLVQPGLCHHPDLDNVQGGRNGRPNRTSNHARAAGEREMLGVKTRFR
jgi:hypothetical protein